MYAISQTGAFLILSRANIQYGLTLSKALERSASNTQADLSPSRIRWMHETAFLRFLKIPAILDVSMGRFIGLSGTYSILPLTTESPCIYACLHWCESRTPGSLPLVSVTTKHTSLRSACNRHWLVVELPYAIGQTGNTEPGDIFWLRQGLLWLQWNRRSFFQDHLGLLELLSQHQGHYLTTVKCKEALPGLPMTQFYPEAGNLTTLWLLSRESWLFLSYCTYTLSCFIYEDVGKPADFAYDGSYRNTTCIHCLVLRL